tara:strand:+ start:1878 stop:2375 length:498 start_codon:yes stop_codon:yes gene_type:complete
LKIIFPAISNELISHLNGEIDSIRSQEKWTFSNNNWNPYLYDGFAGTCLAAKVRDSTKLKILGAIRKHLPLVKQDKYTLNYHYWLPHSGVQWHGDEDYVFGATLYLNDFDKKWGGLFLYQNDSGEIRAEIPKAGKLVIVTKEMHSVTPLIYNAPPRRAVQIWGHK